MHARPQIRILPRSIEIMVNCKRSFTVFKNTVIKITTEGQRHLGVVIGSSKYKRECVQNKIDEFINEIKVSSIIAKTEP